MDYGQNAQIKRHSGWQAFHDSPERAGRRIVLLTTRAETQLGEFRFLANDCLLMGRESTGNRCEQIAQQLLVYGRAVPPSELVEKVEAVDAAAVDRVVRRLLASHPTLATIGPIAHVEPLSRITERLAA